MHIQGLFTTREAQAFTVFKQLFKEYGLPGTIRSDNGVPFACANALYGLSSLSVWWLRLGIWIERIKPGNPQGMPLTDVPGDYKQWLLTQEGIDSYLRKALKA